MLEWMIGSVIGLALLALGWVGASVIAMARPRFLQETLFDSVHMNDRDDPPPVRKLASVACEHTIRRSYVRVDSRPGPGWMADSYAGEACAACGRILKERRTY